MPSVGASSTDPFIGLKARRDAEDRPLSERIEVTGVDDDHQPQRLAVFGDEGPRTDFDAVGAFCDALAEDRDPYGEARLFPPSALGLPEKQSSDFCDETARYADLLAACGELTPVFVDASAAGGDGSFEAPFSTLANAFDACTSGGCHVMVDPGAYEGGLDVPACTFVEGAVVADPASASIKATSARPVIDGDLSVSAHTVLARVMVASDYEAVRAEGGALLCESTLVAGYEAISALWSVEGFDICNSTLQAGYSGGGLRWESHGLRVVGARAAAATMASGSAGAATSRAAASPTQRGARRGRRVAERGPIGLPFSAGGRPSRRVERLPSCPWRSASRVERSACARRAHRAAGAAT